MEGISSRQVLGEGTCVTTLSLSEASGDGSNGHELFPTQFSEASPRGRTENLLIKSKLLSVHRRAQQSTAGTILRLTAKTVPTVRK